MCMATKKLIVGNWKMNPASIAEARKLMVAIQRSAKKYTKVTAVVCPTAFHAGDLVSRVKKPLALGVQNIYWEQDGAHTGEISAYQVAHEKIDYAIVGHSERRAAGETDEEVNKKVHALLNVKVTPIICIGEEERDSDGAYLAHIAEQIKGALTGVRQKDLKNIVIAYEPLWAIGEKATGVVTGEEMHQMLIFIRKILTDTYTPRTAQNVRVLYGGSVHADNAEEIMVGGKVDGFLIGRSSRDPKELAEIMSIAHKA